MKYLIATITLLFAVSITIEALAAKKGNNEEKFIKECVKETGASEAEVALFKKGDFGKPTEKLECFGKCILERQGFMEKAKLNEKKITEKLHQTEPKTSVDHILKICKDVKGKNECQLAFNALKCYSENKAAIV